MLVSLIASSQTGTKNTTTNNIDSIVPLPKNVAKAVAKDLIKGDSLLAEVNVLKKNEKLLQDNLKLKDNVIENKDNIITLYKTKEDNYNTMLTLKDIEKKNLETLANTLKKDLKKTKRELKLTKIGGTAIIGVLAYLILK
jgi:hypothetical protein